MQVKIDPVKCKSVGVCVQQVPDVFQFQPGSKKAEVLSNPVPKHLEKACRQVALECPYQAIELIE